MPKRVTFKVAIATACLALPGVATAASPMTVLEACLDGAPTITGDHVLETGRDSTGRYARVIAGPTVSPTLAAAVNDCANRHGGNTGAAVSSVSTKSLAAPAYNRTLVRSVRAPGGYRNMDCGPSPSILYKGDLYCQRALR